MNRQTVYKTDIGETLPLFDLAPQAPLQGDALIQNDAHAKSEDVHMKTAWQLARALKSTQTQPHAGRRPPRLSSVQRHKVGNAICEHLLASLREQVVAEKRQAGHPAH